ncbi:MAG: hypothetical protein GC189_07480 [Alphaproteobacteria bacterium]|nr:hypothetical protein [Alphaproteobacteria bacterium]
MAQSNKAAAAALSMALASALSACATPGAVAADGEDGEASLPRAISPGRVGLLPNCILSPSEGAGGSESVLGGTAGAVLLAIGDAVIPAVTGYLFDRAIERAEAETRARTASTTASSDGRPSETFWVATAGESALRREFGCVVFVRPAHANSVINPNVGPALDAAYPGVSTWRSDLNAAIPGLALSADAVPELLAEFRVEPITATNAETGAVSEVGFRLRAVTVAYAATGAMRTSAANAKDLTFALSVKGLAPAGSDGLEIVDLYAHDFVMEDVPIGTVAVYRPEDAIAPAALAGQIGPVAARPNPRFEYRDAEHFTTVPLTATMTVTEFEEGGDLARAVLKALADSQGEIRAPIDARLRAVVEDIISEKEDEDED